MVLSTLIKSEVEEIINQANFTPIEHEIFLRRTKGDSLTLIAYDLHISGDTCARISQKINRKIHKLQEKGYI